MESPDCSTVRLRPLARTMLPEPVSPVVLINTLPVVALVVVRFALRVTAPAAFKVRLLAPVMAVLMVMSPVLLLLQGETGATRHVLIDPWATGKTIRPVGGANVLDPDVVVF